MGRTLEHAGFSFPQGYLFGLTLSTAGSSATFSVATGEAIDSTNNTGIMTLGTAISKTTSAWAVGTGNGGIDTGAVANSTWYHVFLIKRLDTGVVDVLFSLSASAPTMPGSYTLKRRIGSMKTNGSAQWIKFIQNGDTFNWDVPVTDITAVNPGTSAVTRTLSTPLGIIVEAMISADIDAATAADAASGVVLSDLALTDTSPAATSVFNMVFFTAATGRWISGSSHRLFTNTSSQIRSRLALSAAGTTLNINTFGWIDTRGKFQ